MLCFFSDNQKVSIARYVSKASDVCLVRWLRGYRCLLKLMFDKEWTDLPEFDRISGILEELNEECARRFCTYVDENAVQGTDHSVRSQHRKIGFACEESENECETGADATHAEYQNPLVVE